MPLEPEPVLVGLSDEPYDRRKEIKIVSEARKRSLAVFGASGAGKSTLFRNMIALDIATGHGVTVVDPHGQLVEDIMDHHIPRWRANDVVYVNLKDPEHAFGLNLLHCPRKDQRGLVVSNTMAILGKLWEDAFKVGARMEDIFRNSLFALIEQPRPASILAIPKLLTDAAYRKEVLANVTNPVVLDFFHSTFERWDNRFREEAISSVLNKCRALLVDPLLRAVIGQARSSIDFRDAIDQRKIILCDLGKGAIGTDNARLLGSIIIMQEKLAALSRTDIVEKDREYHFLFAEEAQNFIGDFASIVAETRKFRLVLSLGTQGSEGLSRETIAAIFTSTPNLITFRVSNSDAERLKDEFAAFFPAAMIQDLGDYKAYVKTLTYDKKGAWPASPVLVFTYPPLAKTPGAEWRSRIERTSNERYTRPRARVDDEIASFLKRKVMRPADHRNGV